MVVKSWTTTKFRTKKEYMLNPPPHYQPKAASKLVPKPAYNSTSLPPYLQIYATAYDSESPATTSSSFLVSSFCPSIYYEYSVSKTTKVTMNSISVYHSPREKRLLLHDAMREERWSNCRHGRMDRHQSPVLASAGGLHLSTDCSGE